MALTKARPPVTEISEMADGDTQIVLTDATPSIDIDVNGANAVDISSSAVTVDPAFSLIATTLSLLGDMTINSGGTTAGQVDLTDGSNITIETTTAQILLST